MLAGLDEQAVPGVDVGGGHREDHTLPTLESGDFYTRFTNFRRADTYRMNGPAGV